MAKKKLEKPGYGKLLDAWCAPDDGGEPVGCLATSFTFDPVFFEEECLSRFLHLETDADEDGPAYLIEREEKLAQVRLAAALIDQHYCRGSRNLRWSLLSARVPRAILHAKVSLLAWSRHLRLIVASANLTEDGYRRNLEVYGVLDYFDGCEAPTEPLYECVTFLRKALRTSEPRALESSAVLKRCEAFLDETEQLAAPWKREQNGRGRRSPRVVPVLTGQGGASVFEQVERAWPAAAPAKRAHVLSPFFDPSAEDNLPAREIWKLLRKRGDVGVDYYVIAEPSDKNDGLRIHAPAALSRSRPSDRAGADVAFHQLKLEASRPLHAKGIFLEDDRWVGYLLGSSNFTRAGLGAAGPANLEANLLYLVDSEGDLASSKSLNQAFPESEPIDLEHIDVSWIPDRNEEAEIGADGELPAAFGAALYEVDQQKAGRLRLAVGADAGSEWSLIREDERPLADAAAWHAATCPSEWIVPWPEERPPSGLWLIRSNVEGRAWWPVNVTDHAALPSPDSLSNLSLEVLIEILTSARPLHRVLADYMKRRRRHDGTENDIVLDPHQRVDTSQFLLQRTRRVSAALRALADRLARPVATKESLAWRLRGPVGVEAVAQAILREAEANQCGAMRSFLIAELVLELSHVKPQSGPGALDPVYVKEKIVELIRELCAKHAEAATDSPENLRQYVERTLTAAGR